MISGLGTFLGLWGFLGSVGSSLDEVFWVPAKIGALLGFLRVSDMRRMNVSIHKNIAMLRRSGQCRNVPESYIVNFTTLRSNIVTFQKVKVSTSRR